MQNTTSVCGLLSNCVNAVTLHLDHMNTSSITVACTMFYNCQNLKQVSLGDFNKNTLTNMQSMFGGCPKLEYVNLKGFDTSKVETTCCMFIDCHSLRTLDLSNFIVSHLKPRSLSAMFGRCKSLETIYLPLEAKSRQRIVQSLRNSFVHHCTGIYGNRKINI